jgi:hypothetical protein
MLTEQEIPTPGTLEYRRTGSTRRYHPGYECKRAENTVTGIDFAEELVKKGKALFESQKLEADFRDT